VDGQTNTVLSPCEIVARPILIVRRVK
jgi:hypothetical protein